MAPGHVFSLLAITVDNDGEERRPSIISLNWSDNKYVTSRNSSLRIERRRSSVQARRRSSVAQLALEQLAHGAPPLGHSNTHGADVTVDYDVFISASAVKCHTAFIVPPTPSPVRTISPPRSVSRLGASPAMYEDPYQEDDFTSNSDRANNALPKPPKEFNKSKSRARPMSCAATSKFLHFEHLRDVDLSSRKPRTITDDPDQDHFPHVVDRAMQSLPKRPVALPQSGVRPTSFPAATTNGLHCEHAQIRHHAQRPRSESHGSKPHFWLRRPALRKKRDPLNDDENSAFWKTFDAMVESGAIVPPYERKFRRNATCGGAIVPPYERKFRRNATSRSSLLEESASAVEPAAQQEREQKKTSIRRIGSALHRFKKHSKTTSFNAEGVGNLKFRRGVTL